MARYDVIILEQAVEEIANSRSYYNQKIEGLGDKFADEVFHLLDIISANPQLYAVKFANIHEAILDGYPFVITYEIFEKSILVLAVFHT